MDKEQIHYWEINLFDAINTVADIEFQKVTWTGNNPGYVSSFSEVINILYSDFGFLDYINYYKSLKGEDKLYKLFLELNDMIEAYPATKDYSYPPKYHDEDILNDPIWLMITYKAKDIVPLLTFTTK